MTIDISTEQGKSVIKEIAKDINTYPEWVDETTAGGLLKGNMKEPFCSKTVRNKYRPSIDHRKLPSGETVYRYSSIMKYIEKL